MSTMHTEHPPIATHGLADDCPRCAEHAENPIRDLDDHNLRTLLRLAVQKERLRLGRSETELVAAAKVLTVLEQAGHLAETDPDMFCEYLKRWGINVAAIPFGAV